MGKKGKHRRRSPIRAAAALAAAVFAAGGLGSWALSRDSAPVQPLPVATIVSQVEAAAAKLPRPAPRPKPRLVIKDVQTYVVQAGDTLSSIAQARCGVSDWEPLWRANRSEVPHPDAIKKGQILVVTCG